MIELLMVLSFSLLSFLIVYGLLNKIKIFEKSVNLIISVISSLFVLFAFEYYSDLIFKIFSFFALLLIFVFMVLSYYFFRIKNQLYKFEKQKVLMDLKKLAPMLLFYSLIFSLSFGQQTDGMSNLLAGVASIIFIATFIIILLFLGGVIKKPSGGVPGFLIFFIILIVVLFVIPMFIPYPQYLEVPENFRVAPLPSYASQIFIMLGLPENWMYVPAIIYLFILPFAAIYTLFWAFLQSLGIFTNVPASVNRVLAFIVAFLTIPMGWFVKLVWVLFSFMGAWSVVIFVATFVIGVFFRGYGKVEEERHSIMVRKWRSEAKSRLQKALIEIGNKQAGAASNHIDAALQFAGFHPQYYSKLQEAKNHLATTPPNWTEAEKAVKEALSYI